MPDRRPDSADVIARMQSGEAADLGLVNDYYTLCVPYYREFLGDHWHTGWHAQPGPPRLQDKLLMELRIAESAGIDAACTVLDVGCGVGGPACHLAQRTGARFFGLTPVAEQLELARRKAADQGLQDRVSFTLGTAQSLPFDDASIDVVLFFESACHFPDRLQFFREAYRVLRPDGRLAGEDWLATWPSTRGDEADLWHRAIEGRWAIPNLGSLKSYADGMRGAGFDNIEAVDLRDEMLLLKGFAASSDARRAVRAARMVSPDPMRRKILEALEMLGEATERGAFTVGRFRAVKPTQ